MGGPGAAARGGPAGGLARWGWWPGRAQRPVGDRFSGPLGDLLGGLLTR